MAAGTWGGYWDGSNIYGRISSPQYGGDTNAQYYRYFGTPSEIDRTFWQSSTGMPFAYQRFVSQEAQPDTYYNRWLQGQQDWMTSQYVDASRANPALQWTDYIAQHAKDLAQRYAALPSWQQGQNPGVWFAGRQM